MPAIAQPPVLTFLANRVRILADGATTAGAFGLIETLAAAAGDMPPLHVHKHVDEGFYMLEGELTLFTPSERLTLRTGDYALAPHGVPHTYRVGEQPARWLTTSQPAGHERFVAAVSTLAKPDPEQLARIAAEHKIEILGPPGTMP
jgi:mannose-6-phosphate isomerase-like protein (cupin superfamily)